MGTFTLVWPNFMEDDVEFELSRLQKEPGSRSRLGTPAGGRSKCGLNRSPLRRQLNSLAGRSQCFYAWVVDELNDGSIEPCIVQRHSIGAACDFVQAFDDPMPENAYELLVSLAAAHAVPAPADRSYASGATCLRTLRDQHLRRLE